MTLSRSPDHGDTATAAAGRELDARVAEVVMGYEWRVSNATGSRCIYRPEFAPSWMNARATGTEPLVGDWKDGAGYLPHCSTNLLAAWKVIDAMMDKRGAFAFHVGQNHESLPYCVFEVNGEQFGREGTSIPHAICLAALAALENAECAS